MSFLGRIAGRDLPHVIEFVFRRITPGFFHDVPRTVHFHEARVHRPYGPLRARPLEAYVIELVPGNAKCLSSQDQCILVRGEFGDDHACRISDYRLVPPVIGRDGEHLAADLQDLDGTAPVRVFYELDVPVLVERDIVNNTANLTELFFCHPAVIPVLRRE